MYECHANAHGEATLASKLDAHGEAVCSAKTRRS